MNNEPVAWMFEKDGAYMCIKHDNRVNYDGGIPLYTHPAKTLTEQDLDKLIKDAEKGGYMDLYITGLIDGFNHARTLLKKASEK